MYKRFRFLGILGAIVVMSAIVASSMSIVEARNSSTPVVTIDLPTQANSGHAPITMTVKVSNPGDAKINFSGMIWHGGQGWSGGDNPYTFTQGTEVYWFEGDTSGNYHFWRGDLLPGSFATFSVPTFTGSSTGTYPFARTTFILTGGGRVNQLNRSITIVSASPTPTATPKPAPTATPTPAPNTVTSSLKAQNLIWPRESWQILYLDITSNIQISRYNVWTTCRDISTSGSAPMVGYYPYGDVHKAFSVYVRGNAREGNCSFILEGNLVDGTPLPYARANITIR